MPQARRTKAKSVVFDLDHDTEKVLSKGKRRYVDEDGHSIYLTGAEIKELDTPDSVKVTVEAA